MTARINSLAGMMTPKALSLHLPMLLKQVKRLLEKKLSKVQDKREESPNNTRRLKRRRRLSLRLLEKKTPS